MKVQWCMGQKVQWIICLGLTVTSASAQPLWYGGVQGGIALGNSQANTSYTNPNRSDNGNLGGRSLLGGLMIGGGGILGKIYLGLEGGVAFQDIEGSYRQSPVAVANNYIRLQMRETFDIFGRIGYRPWKNSLLYLKIGSVWGRWSGQTKNVVLAQSTSKSLFRPGIAGGVGLESSISSNYKKRGQWLWGGEFIYTGFSAFKVNNSPSIGTTSFAPRYAAVTLHIKRSF